MFFIGFVADLVKVRARLEKILSIYNNLQELKQNTDEEPKVAFKLSPFTSNLFSVIIDYNPKVDIVRVVGITLLNKRLQEEYKTKPKDNQIEIKAILDRTIRKRSFQTFIDENFTIIHATRIMFNQNLSAQKLLDNVQECIFVLEDLLDVLIKADNSLRFPKVDNTSDMFR